MTDLLWHWADKERRLAGLREQSRRSTGLFKGRSDGDPIRADQSCMQKAYCGK